MVPYKINNFVNVNSYRILKTEKINAFSKIQCKILNKIIGKLEFNRTYVCDISVNLQNMLQKCQNGIQF